MAGTSTLSRGSPQPCERAFGEASIDRPLGVIGHRIRSLGVSRFGQSADLADLYRHHGIDADAITVAGEAVLAMR